MKDKKTRVEKDNLENLIISKVQPAIDNIMKKFMGVTISELSSDLSSKLTQNPLLGFNIPTKINFRQAKRLFKRDFLKKLLLYKYGNISEVARIADIERRTIHRVINEVGLNVKKIRKEMLKPAYIKQMALSSVLSDVLKNYEQVLHPEKLKNIYADINNISKDILHELPENQLTLKEAEEEFEKQYFEKLLKECDNKIVCVAKRAGMRYETVHRKLRKLGLI